VGESKGRRKIDSEELVLPLLLMSSTSSAYCMFPLILGKAATKTKWKLCYIGLLRKKKIETKIFTDYLVSK
jgi:hypothetical protein